MKRNYDLTPEEVAKCLKFNVVTIHRWAKSGYIPCRNINGFVRFNVEELVEWLDSKRING